MASFGPVAPHYDLLMGKVPYGMWVEYYKLLLAYQGVRPHTLLDVCCGTGTVALMLAKEGFELTGIDLSPEMIRIARDKAQDQGVDVTFEPGDAVDFDLGRKFDGAYSFFDSLNYITDPEKMRLAIARVGQHLQPGGSLIFDLNTAFAFETNLFDQQDTSRTAPIRYSWHGDYDPVSGLIAVSMKFWTDMGSFTETHYQRAHSDEEVRDWLARAGFEKVRVFESYTLEPPRKRSDRVHYAAIKGAEASKLA